MCNVSALFFLSLLVTGTLFAQDRFRFREAALLEARMDMSGKDFMESRSGLGGDTFTEIGLLFRRGEFEAAEAEYSKIIGRFVQNAPPVLETDLPWVLHRLGLTYLEIRDFDSAYQNFSKAAAIRRANVQALEQIAQPAQKQAAYLKTCQEHLLRLLVLLGRLDLAKDDLARADQELAEAVVLGNRYVRLRDADDALYFHSLVLEKQDKWNEADSMWQQAAKIREKMTLSDPYWDMLEDMAGFYARHGDIHGAAEIARRVQTETAGKQLRPNLDIPNKPAWFHSTATLVEADFKRESASSMTEILAWDRWVTDGPDAAAALLKSPPVMGNNRSGSDSDRARLFTYITQRSFLHMSILLDGQPTPERVEQAYQALQRVKGGLIHSIADITTTAESDRNNPHGGGISALSAPVMLDELAGDRTRHAHMFVASALDGKPFDRRAFAKSEQAEQAVTEGLGWRLRTQVGNEWWVPGKFANETTAAIDFTAWERIDRAHPTVSHREYGAFVVREGQPTKYVRLGAADDIERDVDALEAGVVGPHLRGVQVSPAVEGRTSDETERLRHLYQEVIAPLESSLDGIQRLVIVPDGKLTLAPIGAFIDPRGEYVLQRYSICYFGYEMKRYDWARLDIQKTTMPVIIASPDFEATLANSKAETAGPNRMRFDPLPGAEREADDVRQALHLRPDRVLTGTRAREETIRSLGGPEIIHFATHSVPYVGWKIPGSKYDLFDYPGSLEEDPLLQSVIALAGANRPQSGPEDGLLTGLEIASLRLLGTKLVVLSTCEAGQGTPVDGQGVLGLRAAFSMAGVQGLVMSLWPVDDQAGRRFMQFFYSHLKAGPAEAVRLAQVDMLNKTEYKQPRYWAGYSYSGDPELRIDPSDPAAPTTNATGTEVVVAPSCLEVSTRGDDPKRTSIVTYQVKISGAVRKSVKGPGQVTYELLAPSSDLERSTAYGINQGPPGDVSSVHRASLAEMAVSLTIERKKDASAVYIREYVPEGDKRYKPQVLELITLKGGPNLFPSFDIPGQFPEIGAYSEASLSRGLQGKPEKIARISACAVR